MSCYTCIEKNIFTLFVSYSFSRSTGATKPASVPKVCTFTVKLYIHNGEKKGLQPFFMAYSSFYAGCISVLQM